MTIKEILELLPFILPIIANFIEKIRNMSKESLPDTLKTSIFDSLTVYVIHRDVDFEFGHVVGVFSTHEKAEKGLEKALKERDATSGQLIYQRSELSIEEWTLDEYLQA